MSTTSRTAGGPTSVPLDVARVREDFPILRTQVHGRPLVYLDNAATSQKPEPVIAAVDRFYRSTNANVHRGVHHLSQEATRLYEDARDRVRRFLNASSPKEIVFTRGTTEAINLVAQSFGRSRLGPGDEVLITAMEHHSNIVPWQLVCEQTGARLVVAPIDDAGGLVLERFHELLGERTRIVAFSQVSNALGTVNPARRLVEAAHAAGAVVLIDGAQAVPHLPVDVQDLGADFFAFSGHKAYGPTGIGALYGRAELLEAMPPWQGGGDMIETVTFERTTWAAPPAKFEAGTPNVAGAVGLGAALDYLSGIGPAAVAAHEHALLLHAVERLGGVPNLRFIGTADERAGLVSFVVEGMHPHDLGTILDREGIAVRAGHHCAQPVMDRFGVPATTRASFAMYNTPEEIDLLAEGVRKAAEMFA